MWLVLEPLEYPPASFVMTLLGAITAEPDVLLRALRTSKPAGVATSLVYSLTGFPFLFGEEYVLTQLLNNPSFNAWTGDDPDDFSPENGAYPLRPLLCKIYPVEEFA